MFSDHVVGGGQDMAEGRSSEDPPASGTIPDGKCQVGVPTLDLLEGGVVPETVDPLVEPPA